MPTPRQLRDWDSSAPLAGNFSPANLPNLRYPGVADASKPHPGLVVTAPPIGQEVFAFGSADTVHGLLIDGTEVTLWDRSGFPFIHGDDGVTHSQSYTHLIVGSHLGGYADATFAYSAATVHGLGSWARFRLPVPVDTLDEQLPQHSEGILESPYRDILNVDYVVKVRIEHPGRVERSDDFPEGAIINHPDDNARVVFEVSPPAPARVHELLLLDFQALLTFCYGSGAPIIAEWLGASPDSLLRVFRRDDFNKARIVHRLGHFQLVLSPEQSGFRQMVESWWTLIEADFPAPQVVTIYLHSSRGPLEQSTSSVLAATEDLHSRIGPTLHRHSQTTIEGYRTLIKRGLPGPDNAALRAQLYESFVDNRPTLETRLSELLDALTVARFILLDIEPNEWRGLFKRVRNRLAHTGAHVPRRGDSSEDLDRVNGQTRAVLTLLLIQRMGYADETLNRAADVLSKYPHRAW